MLLRRKGSKRACLTIQFNSSFNALLRRFVGSTDLCATSKRERKALSMAPLVVEGASPASAIEQYYRYPSYYLSSTKVGFSQ